MLKSQRSIDSYKRVIPDFPHGYKEWGGVFFFLPFLSAEDVWAALIYFMGLK